MQVEKYLRADDRRVVLLGSTEQHARLSLLVDSILSERVASEAARPPGVPVFPAAAYGLAPYFRAYPGTVSLRVDTFPHLVRATLDGLAWSRFCRVLLCNGHGGKAPAAGLAQEWMAGHPGCRVRFHNWWKRALDAAESAGHRPGRSHASWMENLPWMRLAITRGLEEAKPMANLDRLRLLSSEEARATLETATSAGCISGTTTRCG